MLLLLFFTVPHSRDGMAHLTATNVVYPLFHKEIFGKLKLDYLVILYCNFFPKKLSSAKRNVNDDGNP